MSSCSFLELGYDAGVAPGGESVAMAAGMSPLRVGELASSKLVVPTIYFNYLEPA
jgi:hypothetical protein